MGNDHNNTKNNSIARILLDSIFDPFFIIDHNGVILVAGPISAVRFGTDPEIFKGCSIYELLANIHFPESTIKMKAMVENVFQAGKLVIFEDENDGRNFCHTLYPLFGQDGSVAQLLIFSRIVSDKKYIAHEIGNAMALSQGLIDSTPVSFYIIDKSSRFIAWNSYLRNEIVGKPDREMATVNGLDLIHPDDRAIVENAILDIIQYGLEQSVEARVMILGGPNFRWRRLTGRRWIIDGRPYLIGTSIDMTERKIAEDALRESEARFRRLFQMHSSVMLIIDPETGEIIDANQAASTFYGWTIAELRQMRIQQIDILPSETMQSIMEKYRSSSLNSVQFRHRRADGSTRDVEVFTNNIELADNSPTYAIINDITGRKLHEAIMAFRLNLLQMAETYSVEELLQASLDKAELLTESAFGFGCIIEKDAKSTPSQLWSTNAMTHSNGEKVSWMEFPLDRIDAFAEAVREKKGVICNDFFGLDQYRDMVESHPEIRRILIMPVVRGETIIAIIAVGNKARDYEYEDFRILESLSHIACDIVARKRAEESENSMLAMLLQLQKIELVGQLAGGIAHDFNNMMSVILGNIDLAMEDCDEKNNSFYLNEIQKAATRSANLTRQLLAFARKQPANPSIVDLNTIIESMLTMLRQLIGEQITLVWKPDSSEAMVKIDPTQLDQILVNLCINARDAISGIGRITIQIEKVCRETSMCESGRCSTSYHQVKLSVTDTGTGMAKEVIAHIFEPFYTTKAIGKGNGLGLSTVYGIVKQNNGFIEVQSSPGKGSTFTITLPHCEEYAVHDDLCSPLSEEENIHSDYKTILLVEDEPDILKLCRTILQHSGYLVLSASTPDEAIRLASEYHGKIDLLLTDVIMPVMNGHDLSKQLVLIYPDLRTLYMSGYTADIIASQGLIAEGMQLIQKPFSVKKLIYTVQNLLKSTFQTSADNGIPCNISA